VQSPEVLAPASSVPTFEIVAEGDRVVASGVLTDDRDDGIVVCTQTLAASVHGAVPVCIGVSVQVEGLTANDRTLLGRRVSVTGTWRANRIAVDSVDVVQRSSAELPEVPCAEPAGGWPGNGPALAAERAAERLTGFVAGLRDTYAGTWAARIPGGDEIVHVVATTSSVGEAETQLRSVFAVNLCVVEVAYSGAELATVARALTAEGWRVDVDPVTNRVAVTLPLVDEQAAQRLDDHVEMIVVRPLVRPA
jgi:hypothetical protein